MARYVFQVSNKGQVFIICLTEKKNMENGKMVLKHDGQKLRKLSNIFNKISLINNYNDLHFIYFELYLGGFDLYYIFKKYQ